LEQGLGQQDKTRCIASLVALGVAAIQFIYSTGVEEVDLSTPNAILIERCSATTPEAEAFATLETSIQLSNVPLPERVSRPRPHLEFASDPA